MLRVQQRLRNDDHDNDTSIELISMPPSSEEEGLHKSTLTNNPWVDEVLDLETGTGTYRLKSILHHHLQRKS